MPRLFITKFCVYFTITNNAAMNIPLLRHTGSGNFLLIAGPCVIENEDVVFEIANHLFNLSEKYRIPFVFKASYRKANRSRNDSFTGIGDTRALVMLKKVRDEFNIPVITDIHNPPEAEIAARYVDILQIPAFLCRQTDLLEAAAVTGKWVNIKKGQFLSGSSMKYAVEKVRDRGNNNIMVTDRGNMFGYQDIVVDFRNIPLMQKENVPVIMDITHSLQQPNQPGGVSGGDPAMIETIGKAAISVGADGLFIETHPDPSKAKSDGANMLHLTLMESLLLKCLALRKTVNSF